MLQDNKNYLHVLMFLISYGLENILRRFLVFFFYIGRPKFLNPISYYRHRRDNKAKLELESNYPELFEIINRLDNSMDSMDSMGSMGCEYSDYLLLYEFVRKHKPSKILELGSGKSTAAFAYALKQNKNSHGVSGIVTTIEEQVEFYNQAQNSIPTDLNEYVNFIYSPRETSMFGSHVGYYYKEIPSESYDLVYIDGPTLKKDPVTGRKPFNADLIRLISSGIIHQSWVLMDQRIGNLWSYRVLLPDLKFRYDVILKISFARYDIKINS